MPTPLFLYTIMGYAFGVTFVCCAVDLADHGKITPAAWGMVAVTIMMAFNIYF